MAQITEIGVVESKYREPADPFEMRKEESSIIIKDEFTDGLYGIEENRYLQILFHFNKSESYRLRGSWYYGGEKGVFACRSPKRPGAIGLTTVELLELNGNRLRVKGLDALDGTPVLDIKPLITETDQGDDDSSGDLDGDLAVEFEKRYPRSRLIQYMKTRDMDSLLMESGKLHGHYCPGLAMGVAATVYGLHMLAQSRGVSVADLQSSDGMEELISIIEINSCFADGVQFVSGCTLGNNALIYKDLGRTAVTFCQRNGPGIRVSVRQHHRDIMKQMEPQFQTLFNEVVVEKSRNTETLKDFKECARNLSFKLVNIEPEKLFTITETEVKLPDYAPIRDSVICRICGEDVMGGKLSNNEKDICKSCGNNSCYVLDGTGINMEEI